MNGQDLLAERFEAHRSRLRSVAFRMLGSTTEDDAVQEAWIRLSRTDTGDVDDLRAWLTTVVARVCLNMLRARKTRRESSLETYVPYPILSDVDRKRPAPPSLGPFARSIPGGVTFIRLVDQTDLHDPVQAAEGRSVSELHQA